MRRFAQLLPQHLDVRPGQRIFRLKCFGPLQRLDSVFHTTGGCAGQTQFNLSIGIVRQETCGMLQLLDRRAKAPKMNYACTKTKLPGWEYPNGNGLETDDADNAGGD